MGTLKINKNLIKETEEIKSVETVSEAAEKAEPYGGESAELIKLAHSDGGFIEELKNLRGESEVVYRRNDGTCRKIISAAPQFYRDGEGNLKEIKSTLTDKGNSIENQANSFKLKFDKDGSDGKIFELQKGGKTLTLSSAEHAKAKGHACGCKCELCVGSDNKVKAMLNDGTEIEYVSLNDRVKENIIIREKQEKYEYEFTLNVGDLTVEEGTHNDLLLKDKETGKTEFVIPAPYMFDANNKRSDNVSYEVDVNGGELAIKVIADAEFINAEDRAFPVTIDPQIVDSKETDEGIIEFGHIEGGKKYKNFLQARGGIKGYVDYIAPTSIDEGTITGVKLVLSIDTGMGTAYIYDKIKEDFIGDNIDASENDAEIEIPIGIGKAGTIEVRAASNSYIEFRSPWLVIDYVDEGLEFEANNPPMIKDFDFTDKAKGHLYVKYGILATSFKSFGSTNFVLPLDIMHCHKVGVGIAEFGKDWRINLNKKLTIHDSDKKSDTVYVYTDELGDKYILSEKYYSADGDLVSTIRDKQLINIDINGNMTYNGKPVYKHQSCNGLTLIPEINDFKNYELLQQKRDEQIQLEDYVNQLFTTLKNYVIVSPDTGEICSNLSSLSKGSYDAFIEELSGSKILVTESEAIQLRNLYLGVNKLEIQIGLLEQKTEQENGDNNSTEKSDEEESEDLLEQQKTNTENQLLETNKQILLLIQQAHDNESLVKDTFNKYFSKKAELDLLLLQTPVNYLRDEKGIINGFNKDGDLVVIFDNYGNYVNITYDINSRIFEIYDSKGKSMKFEYKENLLFGITDNCGRQVRYYYKNSKLEDVVFADGSSLHFKYQGENSIMRSVESSTGLQAKISVEDFSVKEIAINSKPITIKAGSITGEEGFSKNLSNIDIEYDINEKKEWRTKFTSKDNFIERYTFNSKKRFIMSEKIDNCFVKTVKSYTYGTGGNVIKTVTQNDLKETEEETFTYNELNKVVKKESGWTNISDTVKIKTIINYEYDASGNLIKETTTKQTDVSGTVTPTTEITKYSYNANGSLILSESFVEGEEQTSGIKFEQRVYDDNGNVTKTISWNSLDSSSKFYTESDRAENGQLKADRDETGEVSAEYEYVDGTNVVNTVKYPNGSKFAYGRNPYNNQVNSITQSTDNGEANSTDITYNYSLPVEVKSGNTTLGYTYDHTRRKTEVSVNGVTQATYSYKDYTYNEKQNKCTFGEKKTELDDGKGISTSILQSKTGLLDSVSGRIKVAETTKLTDDNSTNNEVIAEVSYTKQYDENGRLISAGERTYTYDSYDNITSISGGDIDENYTYNEYGEVTAKAYTIGEETETYSYAYKDNAARELEYITLGDYKFKPLTDVNGRNTGKEIYSGENKVAAEYITYRKVGDHATNMPATVWFGSGAKIADSIKYKYDSCGNICQITQNGHVVAKYAYDSLNRLIREDNKAIGKTTLFAYDNTGNITERCEYAYTTKSGEELEELDCTHYSYDYEGDKLVNYNGKEFKYNNLGNPIGDDIKWEYGTRLTKWGDTTFTYDGLGRRTSKGDISFTYDSDGKLIKQSNGLEFIYDNSGVVGVKYDGEQYFYRKDTQGNIIVILDNSGNIVVNYIYDAWGNHAVVDNNGNDVESGIGVLNPFRYRGYYYDTETGLYYLQTRYYDPEIGRFISQDSLEYADPETINGLNLYAYCGNNPVMNVDPTGEFFLTFLLIALGVGLAVGAMVGGISAAVHGENIWNGIWKGALIGAMFGASIALVGAGLVAPLASTFLGSVVIGAGIGSAFALSLNLSAQLQNGGFGSLDMKSIGTTWGIGLGVGALAGGMGYAGKVIGATIGQQLGLSLAGKTFLGTVISQVIPKAILSGGGTTIGGALGGYLAGKFINDLAIDTGMQNKAVPLWFGTLLKMLF